MEKIDLSVMEVAGILNITRQAVLKKIKSGELIARKVGRSYIIRKEDLSIQDGGEMTIHKKEVVDEAVKKTIRDYGETLKLLGKE